MAVAHVDLQRERHPPRGLPLQHVLAATTTHRSRAQRERTEAAQADPQPLQAAVDLGAGEIKRTGDLPQRPFMVGIEVQERDPPVLAVQFGENSRNRSR